MAWTFIRLLLAKYPTFICIKVITTDIKVFTNIQVNHEQLSGTHTAENSHDRTMLYILSCNVTYPLPIKVHSAIYILNGNGYIQGHRVNQFQVAVFAQPLNKLDFTGNDGGEFLLISWQSTLNQLFMVAHLS